MIVGQAQVLFVGAADANSVSTTAEIFGGRIIAVGDLKAPGGVGSILF